MLLVISVFATCISFLCVLLWLAAEVFKPKHKDDNQHHQNQSNMINTEATAVCQIQRPPGSAVWPQWRHLKLAANVILTTWLILALVNNWSQQVWDLDQGWYVSVWEIVTPKSRTQFLVSMNCSNTFTTVNSKSYVFATLVCYFFSCSVKLWYK